MIIIPRRNPIGEPPTLAWFPRILGQTRRTNIESQETQIKTSSADPTTAGFPAVPTHSPAEVRPDVQHRHDADGLTNPDGTEQQQESSGASPEEGGAPEATAALSGSDTALVLDASVPASRTSTTSSSPTSTTDPTILVTQSAATSISELSSAQQVTCPTDPSHVTLFQETLLQRLYFGTVTSTWGWCCCWWERCGFELEGAWGAPLEGSPRALSNRLTDRSGPSGLPTQIRRLTPLGAVTSAAGEAFGTGLSAPLFWPINAPESFYIHIRGKTSDLNELG